MAYNPKGVYEAPRRPYYPPQQPPPRQNEYAGQYQEQQQYNEYDQQYYDQGYEQGYDRSYGQYNGHEQPPPQYAEAYADRKQPSHGYGLPPPPPQQQQQQRQERQYDPRYRQRPEKAAQQGYEQQSRHDRHYQASADEQYQSRSRPNPSAARFHSPEARPQKQSFEQQQRLPPIATGRPQTAPQQQKMQDPAKMTMDEWKAKEKARMHTAALSPETLAQDNAFPVFPTYQNRSRPGTAQGTSDGAASPTTDVRKDEQLALSRNNSHDDRLEQPSGRPMLDHKPFSFDAVAALSKPRPSSPPQPRRLSRQDSQLAPIPVERNARRQRPMLDQQQQQSSQSQFQNDDNRMYEETSSAAHQSPPRLPPVQPIDTRQTQQSQKLAYMDHGPLSPAVVPPRPSSAQGTRSAVAQPVMSPTSAHSQPARHDKYPEPVRTFANPNVPDHPDGAYSDHRIPPPVTAAPMSRAQQIEAEMPDFDSAAPGGTSLLHKRNQTPEAPIVAELPSPPPVPLQPNLSLHSLPNQSQRFYGYDPDSRSMSLPGQSAAKPQYSGITERDVFEVPGDASYQDHYDTSYLADSSHPQQAHAQQPFQPPFAREQPRRSMDDARQMPYRQGPPHPQRLPPNARPPRGQYPPQQRPPVGRNFSSQSAYSAGMPERGGSAPPRQAFQGPPAMGSNGAPLARQPSAPEQQGHRHRLSDPDALPRHPPPVRPGLMDNGPGPMQNTKPPPVRNYGNGQPAQQQHQRQASIDPFTKPVTPAELDSLRAYVSANPNNNKQALVLAKKLVEAGTVLASEGGRADPRQTATNRERYILDGHKLVKKLVAAGYPDAMFYLADCYGSGELGLEVDPREAFKLYQAAAKAGHGEAAYRTAMCCEMGSEEGGGTNRDYAKAVQWYRRAAALGDPSGMFKVGVISLKGLLGQPRNVGEAVSWLKRSIQGGEKDNPHALYELGLLYESSNTAFDVRNKVVADDAYALELFQRAAAAGHKFSQFRLGQAYEYGQMGLTIDNRASISWYSKAAAQGEHQAELALSGWYLTGAEGILEHSDMEAYLWARKAASSEPPLAKAMFAMGYFTETGIGCPASVEEAKKWYGRAASYNFPKARERLEELKRNGGRNSKQLANGKLSRNQKRDESECVVM